MNRCATCKHWGVTGTYCMPNGEERSYAPPILAKGFKQCLKLEGVLDQDGEPCAGNAHLGTEADFGCVLWEGKE